MADSMRQRLEAVEDRTLAPYALRSAAATRRYPIENEGRAFDYRTQLPARPRSHRLQPGLSPPAAEGPGRDPPGLRGPPAQPADPHARGDAAGPHDRTGAASQRGSDRGHRAGARPRPAAVRRRRRARRWTICSADGSTAGAGRVWGTSAGFERAWQSLRVVDRIEKRYAHPGLNLTDPVREGILKSARRTAGSPDEPRGRARRDCPRRSRPRSCCWPIASPSALHDLDDALQSGRSTSPRSNGSRRCGGCATKLGARYRGARRPLHEDQRDPPRPDPPAGRPARCWPAGADLARWAERHDVRDAARFARGARRGGRRGGDRPAPRGPADAARRSSDSSTAACGAATPPTASTAAAVAWCSVCSPPTTPTRCCSRTTCCCASRRSARVRFLRDLPRDGDRGRDRIGTTAAMPRFARLLADHLASMTDAYALAEHARLLEMGAVPIPSAEQLRRERSRDALNDGFPAGSYVVTRRACQPGVDGLRYEADARDVSRRKAPPEASSR